GPCLVNCRLQIGQGLVITYVIFLPLTEAKSPVRYHARRLPESLRLCRPVAQDRSVPAHIAETTSVYDSARPNSTTLSSTCRMRTPSRRWAVCRGRWWIDYLRVALVLAALVR